MPSASWSSKSVWGLPWLFFLLSWKCFLLFSPFSSHSFQFSPFPEVMWTHRVDWAHFIPHKGTKFRWICDFIKALTKRWGCQSCWCCWWASLSPVHLSPFGAGTWGLVSVWWMKTPSLRSEHSPKKGSRMGVINALMSFYLFISAWTAAGSCWRQGWMDRARGWWKEQPNKECEDEKLPEGAFCTSPGWLKTKYSLSQPRSSLPLCRNPFMYH